MSNDTSPTSQMVALGEALRRARGRAKLSAVDAAKAMGISRQAYSKYESGETAAILRSDVLRRLANSVRSSEDELHELARSGDEAETLKIGRQADAPDYQLAVWGRVKAGPEGPYISDIGNEPEQLIDMSWMFGPDAGALIVVGDSVKGRAESGQLAIYYRNMWPKRDQLCVVHMKTGEMYIKIYEKADASTLFVTQTFPEMEVKYPLRDVQGVYRVRFVEQ
ncbi:MAG: helix-turn-helix transcriptional regulator [Caulobacteraceae bacterium]